MDQKSNKQEWKTKKKQKKKHLNIYQLLCAFSHFVVSCVAMFKYTQ